MKISAVRAIPMSDPVPPERRHRTDIGTKVKSDAVLILVEAEGGLVGMGASLGPWGALRRLPDEPHRAARRACPRGRFGPSNDSTWSESALMKLGANTVAMLAYC